MMIGKTLKKIREQKKMKLSTLAQRSGVQIATLSRIENLKMSGTVECHIKIAKALSIDITQLYLDIISEKTAAEIQHNKAQAEIFSDSKKSSYEILTSNFLSKKMMPTLIKIEPQGSTNKEQNQIGSEKFIFVVKGKVEVIIQTEHYQLSANHSLYFDASLQHQFKNMHNTIAKLICVMTPVAL